MPLSDEMMEILVNNKSLKVRKGTSLGRILAKAGSPHRKGTVVVVGEEGKEAHTRESRLVITTTRGTLALDLDPVSVNADLVQRIASNLRAIQLIDGNAVTIGSFESNERIQYGEYKLNAGDILIDAAGMDLKNVCLVISKRPHEAYYSAIRGGLAGNLAAGFNVLQSLNKGDKILDVRKTISPSIEVKSSYWKTDDMEQPILSEGASIFSFVKAALSDESPQGGEILLNLFENGCMEIDMVTGGFASVKGYHDILINEGTSRMRSRGAITIRNVGKNRGRIYFYKEARPESEAHTIVAQVCEGIQLVDSADRGDTLSIFFEPSVINVLGYTQHSAYECLAKDGIEQVRGGDTADDAIVVRQIPYYSVEIMRSREVQTIGLPHSKLIRIQLFDQVAPRSVRLFRMATGMTFNRIGMLRVAYPYSPLVGALLMGKSTSRFETGRIEPENVPAQEVKCGEIGITNSVKQRAGIIGIRVDESRQFGPTCEDLDSTNIVGIVLKASIGILKELGDGEEAYFIEEGRSRSSLHPA